MVAVVVTKNWGSLEFDHLRAYGADGVVAVIASGIVVDFDDVAVVAVATVGIVVEVAQTDFVV